MEITKISILDDISTILVGVVPLIIVNQPQIMAAIPGDNPYLVNAALIFFAILNYYGSKKHVKEALDTCVVEEEIIPVEEEDMA